MAPDSKRPRPVRAESPVSLWEDVSRELWEVQLPLLAGASRLMANDEIDAALARGEISARTLVRKHGASAWITLRDLRGLEPSAVLSMAPRATAAPPPKAVAPVAPPPPKPNQPAASPRIDVVPLSTEELAVARPSSPLGKIIAVAVVALATGGIFAAMSSRFTGAHAKVAAPTSMAAATQALAAPPAVGTATTRPAPVVASAAPAPTPAPTPEPQAAAAAPVAAAPAQASPPAASPPPTLANASRSSVTGTVRATRAPASPRPPAEPTQARTPKRSDAPPKKVAAAPAQKPKTADAKRASPAKKDVARQPRHRAAHMKPRPSPARPQTPSKHEAHGARK